MNGELSGSLYRYHLFVFLPGWSWGALLRIHTIHCSFAGGAGGASMEEVGAVEMNGC